MTLACPELLKYKVCQHVASKLGLTQQLAHVLSCPIRISLLFHLVCLDVVRRLWHVSYLGSSSSFGALAEELMAVKVPVFNREQCRALQSTIGSGYNLDTDLAQNAMCITNTSHGGQGTCTVKQCLDSVDLKILKRSVAITILHKTFSTPHCPYIKHLPHLPAAT